MTVLTKEQIILLHSQLTSETGGTDGLRDEQMLESAISAPFQTFDGVELFPTVVEKIARLGFGLIANHAFIDGNKRTGAHVMFVMLALNGIRISYTQEELIDIILAVASGIIGYEGLLDFIRAHIKQ